MPVAHTADSAEIKKTLGVGREGRRRVRAWLVGSALIAASVVVVVLLRAQRGPATIQYQTAAVTQGTLTVTVTATGSLEALTQVKVGTEISGIVDKVFADYNTPVAVGQLLATINTDKIQAQAEQARAGLAAARAKQLQAEATLAEGRAQLARLEHVRALSGGRVPSTQELDAQGAGVKRAEADLASVAAQVTQSEASLAAIETDLRKANIRSPIQGIVLDRQVDPGQTVAASFQTPTLFTLAEDLARMKLIVDMDEADVGAVRVGQPAVFRVDAYPDQRFDSRVTEVRSTPKTSNGVVTYQTVLIVDNSGLLLKPGMTATAEVTVTSVPDALLVPNAALRFVPPAIEATPAGGGGIRSFLPRPPGMGRARPIEAPTDKSHQRVFVLVQDELTALELAVGASDGQYTQVLSGALVPDTQVVVDMPTTKK